MIFKILFIEPRSPFHIGIKEGSLEKTMHHVPSDTLFSALCNVYRIVYGREKLEKLLKEFVDGRPPFIVSSIFPCINGKPLFPLPRNIDKYRLEIEGDGKALKGVEFVDEGIFRRLLKGEKVTVRKENLIQKKVISLERRDVLWREIERPRVSIDRLSSSTEIYHFGEVIFTDKLHFLIDISDDELEEEILTTLRVLGDEGIGGDRTCGRGLFSISEIREIEFDEIDSEWFVTLSMVYPRKDEMIYLKESYFELLERGGWVYSPEERGLRKRFVRMIREGSVIRGKMKGRLVEVARGDYPIYRYGYAFLLPLRVGR